MEIISTINKSIQLCLLSFSLMSAVPAIADQSNSIAAINIKTALNPQSNQQWLLNDFSKLNVTKTTAADSKYSYPDLWLTTAAANTNTFVTDTKNEQSANNSVSPVPLPASVLLFGSALTGLIGYSSRKRWYVVLKPAKNLSIMGLSFPVLNYEQTMMLFQEWINAKTANQVFFANVHNTVSCLNDNDLLDISNNSLNTMDGLPIVWYAKLVHQANNASRVSGPDLMLKCLEQGCDRGWKHFFLGGSEQVLHDLVCRMEERYPRAEIVGSYSPPFRSLSAQEDAELIAMINAAKPDFLWVGLGAPKQEKWIAEHLQSVHVPVQLGVGAAFNFHSGHVQRAPEWMQKRGLEWLYRMLKETRLIKRYLETNPVFLIRFAKDFLKIRILKLKQS